MYSRANTIRLSFGMSTPAIRGTGLLLSYEPNFLFRRRSPSSKQLSLPLLVPRIRTNHADHTPPPDDLAILTYATDTAAHFHDRILNPKTLTTVSQHISTPSGHGYRVLEVRCILTVFGHHRPT